MDGHNQEVMKKAAQAFIKMEQDEDRQPQDMNFEILKNDPAFQAELQDQEF